MDFRGGKHMDENRFDRLARALATGSSRRHLLRMIASTALGGAVVAFLVRPRMEALDGSAAGEAMGSDAHGRKCPSGNLCNGHCCAADECCMRGLYCASAGDCI
jgi:hypothetical protein